MNSTSSSSLAPSNWLPRGEVTGRYDEEIERIVDRHVGDDVDLDPQFVDEFGEDFDQCSVRAPAAGTIKVLVTLGQLVSTYAPTALVQLTPDAK